MINVTTEQCVHSQEAYKLNGHSDYVRLKDVSLSFQCLHAYFWSPTYSPTFVLPPASLPRTLQCGPDNYKNPGLIFFIH